MSYVNLLVDVNNYIATVTINKPPVNSVNLATIQEINKVEDCSDRHFAEDHLECRSLHCADM